MKSLLPAHVIAAVSLAVLFPLAANASGASPGETHAHQTLNTQYEPGESAHGAHDSNGASHAMATTQRHDRTTGSAESGQRQHGSEERAFASRHETQGNNFTNTLDPLKPGYLWWQ
ncbi:hypothetical protein [Halomonas shantousis]